MSKKYQIERAALVKLAVTDSYLLCKADDIREDLIKGSESVITAEDLLADLVYVPSIHIVGFDPLVFPAFVPAEDVKIIYTPTDG